MDHKILETARELIDEVGYPALTIDQVAARAGVGKAAIYRRYASKAEMAFIATVHGQWPPPQPDTGSLHGDLLELARTYHTLLAAPASRHVAPALMSELAVNPELVTRFQDNFQAAELAGLAEIIQRAVARGELARPVDPAIAHLLLIGSHVAALYLFHQHVDDTTVTSLATATTAGLIALADQE
ncbi:TetR/AcrR family transcriptional regulator [Nonomuraea typhae]|uniref:TetR/AcrR family transcriptional regulator n=1 Tax=Nonomuraea typhae TaxID=2603600 RepID=A0ABW7ZAE1_9ACTN